MGVWVTAEFRAFVVEFATKEQRAIGAIFEDAVREYARHRKQAKRRGHTLG
jgi:hypothetical protein